ncbi:MFS transporter [Roseiarcus sp.]|uniref:MFS transporter n=1 Tax=Roseiarcus sp. TaxID=1969460 RepID=UPI003C479AFA
MVALSASHMLNDVMQSLAPALYPVFRAELALSFFQIGIITFVFQLTASLLQPLIGLAADRRPMNWILPVGMAFTLIGLFLLAFAKTYLLILASVAVIGIGSAVFHPEASRVARAASGGRHGFAQSLFQVGGNFGQSIGPLLAAFVVVPFGQHSVLAFTILALVAVVLLTRVSRWHVAHRAQRKHVAAAGPAHPRPVVIRTIAVLIVMLFSKVVYLASIGSYYTFYLIDTFHVTIQQAQVMLFVFLAAVAAGTFLGGPLTDRFGAKFVIWGSILGVLPFTLLLPHLGFAGTIVNSIAIGLVISSAFSAMVVYAQELTPGNVGAVAGLFFGLSFGLGGIGAALLGILADRTSIGFVYQVCAFLPAIGLLGALLPQPRPATAAVARD